MYIRRVTRKNKDGTTEVYLRLAQRMGSESQKVKAKGIDSLGREDEVDRAALERLAKRISRFLCPRQAWEIETLVGEESDYARKCLSSLWYQGMRGILFA